MRNIQEVIAAMNQLNQRLIRVEGNTVALKKALEQSEVKIQELQEEVAELKATEPLGDEEDDGEGVVDVPN